MKKVILSLLFLLTVTVVWAQVPQQISYQSVIRDGNNVVVASSPVGIKISLLKGTATGPAVYVETHRKTTNANGLVSLEIGTGTVLSGSFASIDWANGPYLIQTETDPTGGSNYSIPFVAALNSVPYALYAANGTPGPKGDKGDTGVKGDKGDTGSTGPQGPIGLTGPAGPQGPAGSTGAQGPIGLTGPAGPQGLAGNDGAAGSTGPQGPIGLTGPAGSQGPIGLTGPAGSQGIQGPTGAIGATGAAGVDGKTVLNGTTNPTNQGVDGDFYINTNSNTLFGPKASGTWPSGVSLIGPQGVTGSSGAAGAQGPIGLTGPAGSQGIQGPTGATGAAGVDGKTVLNGTTNPTNQGVDGDFYINTNSNTLFGPKASGTWPSGFSLVGPQGATGAAGAQGVQGPTGATGATGAAGVDGKTVLNGTTNPTNQGVDGDFYINTNSNTLFGPKASGTWPSGVSLIGPQGVTGSSGAAGAQGPIGLTGPAGSQGIQGPTGATGAAGVDGKTVLNGTTNPTTQGVDGDFYINTNSNTLFGPKASGTWP